MSFFLPLFRTKFTKTLTPNDIKREMELTPRPLAEAVALRRKDREGIDSNIKLLVQDGGRTKVWRMLIRYRIARIKQTNEHVILIPVYWSAYFRSKKW